MKEFILFIVGMGVAGVIGVVVTQAGSEPSGEEPLDTSAIILVPDAVAVDPNAPEAPAGAVLEAAASKQTYEIPEWGIELTGVDVQSHRVDGDSLLFKSKGYEQLQAALRMQDQDFEQCVGYMVRMHRIARSKTTDDLNAQPWWTVRAELEAAGRLVGDTYYYFQPNTAESCSGGSDVFSASYPTLWVDREQALKGLR